MFHVTSYPHISYVTARFVLCNTLWVIKNRTWWCNTSSTWGSPDTCSAAASSIPVTRPGHDFDCAQAPMRLVAYTGASIVTCSRLVVSEIWDWTWTAGVASLVAAIDVIESVYYRPGLCSTAHPKLKQGLHVCGFWGAGPGHPVVFYN